MSLKIAYQFARGDFDKAMAEIYEPIAEAGTLAIKAAADQAKLKARANIAAAGFSKKWQNALRADVFPKKGVSANAAAYIYHAIPYADVFEEGAVVRGKPKVWLPLTSTPKKKDREKLTPERFAREIGDLYTINRPGRNPLLAARMRVSAAAAKRGPPYKVSISSLIAGARSGPGSVVSVPVFVGVTSVNIAKKFNIRQVIADAAEELPRLYLENLKVE